ncbi:GNAT family N-acetyltransferase [Clostridium estertheticum]|uniref:GNAT family N-acetyltransferase n=1 Tax=Clostridium estertheticum TaxID=238834 RepID=UPI0013E92F52|nr:GNAT family N-acetyltransferase [Clostridium estertheticum]MBZ9689706.1 GNAT family N-acetyltransferase [Clostridium estertheticum]
MKNNIYKECPIYTTEILTLRLTSLEDVSELLRCYSDKKAVPLFNSDNCHGDDFHYTNIERMKEAVDFWQYSYEHRYFVRLTVILNTTGEKIGTIEMFKRETEDEFNHFGVLRIDLQSKYEKQQYINEILQIANQDFYKAFKVDSILTKAIPNSTERISSLESKGYVPINKKFVIYDDYFVRMNATN